MLKLVNLIKSGRGYCRNVSLRDYKYLYYIHIYVNPLYYKIIQVLGTFANCTDPVLIPEMWHLNRVLTVCSQEIFMQTKVKAKIPKNTNGLIKMIRMDKSSGQKRVK